MILACDVGGTKTRLALFESRGEGLDLFRDESYPSREHQSLDEIVARFVGTRPPLLTAAGFGVAGPVVEGRVHTTNLPWVVDAARLARQLGLRSVALINDLEAHAWSVERLGPGDVEVLQGGEARPSGNVGILAAGTGLGFSALVRSGDSTVSLASEGGHADFAPRSEVEIELLRHLRGRYGRVSSERVLSGPGLLNIYEFLRDTGRGEEPAWLADEMRSGDPSAAISRAGQENRSPLCRQAVLLFLGIYGAEARNWALRTLATGGVYLGGGIAPKLLGKALPAGGDFDPRGTFLRDFLDAGRLRPLLEAVPVSVVMNDRAALIGAAHFASRTAPGR